MTVRVWQSHAPSGRSQLADWEMECSEHVDQGRTTSTDWLWAMEAAWGHIAMHHRREPTPCEHEYGWHPVSRPEEHRCLDCGVPLSPTSHRPEKPETRNPSATVVRPGLGSTSADISGRGITDAITSADVDDASDCLCAHVPSIPDAPDVSCPRCMTSHHPRNDETTESEGNR